MKLNYFSEQTCPKTLGRTAVARVSFNKAGVINFNQAACDLIGVKIGSKISLAQDDEHPENWYFFIDDQHGFELRGGYDKKGCLFNHAGLIKAFNECFQFDNDTTRGFIIAGKPTLIAGSKTKYWGILIVSTVEDE